MALYGLGYGLGKMGEGLSSGLLQGTMTGLTLEMQKRKEDQALRIAQAKETGLERRHGETLAETKRYHIEEGTRKQNEYELTKITRGVQAAKQLYDIGGTETEINEFLKSRGITKITVKREKGLMKVDTGTEILIIPDKIVDDFGKIPDSDVPKAINQGIGTKVIQRFPKSGAPMTEAQKKEYGPGGFKEQEIGLKKREVGVKEKAEVRKAGEPTKFKDEKVREMWGSLSEEERKRVIGARLDPHDLTEKNILDVYGNIMTDPTVKKALQPIAEQIMKKAVEKGGIGKELDEATAKQILIEAGGDKEKARKLAKDRGYKF